MQKMLMSLVQKEKFFKSWHALEIRKYPVEAPKQVRTLLFRIILQMSRSFEVESVVVDCAVDGLLDEFPIAGVGFEKELRRYYENHFEKSSLGEIVYTLNFLVIVNKKVRDPEKLRLYLQGIVNVVKQRHFHEWPQFWALLDTRPDMVDHVLNLLYGACLLESAEGKGDIEAYKDLPEIGIAQRIDLKKNGNKYALTLFHSWWKQYDLFKESWEVIDKHFDDLKLVNGTDSLLNEMGLTKVALSNLQSKIIRKKAEELNPKQDLASFFSILKTDLKKTYPLEIYELRTAYKSISYWLKDSHPDKPHLYSLLQKVLESADKHKFLNLDKLLLEINALSESYPTEHQDPIITQIIPFFGKKQLRLLILKKSHIYSACST